MRERTGTCREWEASVRKFGVWDVRAFHSGADPSERCHAVDAMARASWERCRRCMQQRVAGPLQGTAWWPARSDPGEQNTLHTEHTAQPERQTQALPESDLGAGTHTPCTTSALHTQPGPPNPSPTCEAVGHRRQHRQVDTRGHGQVPRQGSQHSLPLPLLWQATVDQPGAGTAKKAPDTQTQRRHT